MASSRRCVVLRGERAEVLRQAEALVAGVETLWVLGPQQRRELADRLGQAFDAVVLDLHDGLDADALGRAHGLVWGEGALVLLRPPTGALGSETWRRRLAAPPYEPNDVGQRFETRAERILAEVAVDPTALRIGPRPTVAGTAEQAEAVERLVRGWTSEPRRWVLTADRGRGKSAALGLALARFVADRPDARIAVTAAAEVGVDEIRRFGPSDRALYVPVTQLLAGSADYDVLAIDEAAALSVPLLQRLVARYPSAHLVFATTTHGYEGSGRGFGLRFVEWLERRPVAVERISLAEPIRWGREDALERAVFDALLLDAELAPLSDAPDRELDAAAVSFARVDRDALVADERRLRQLFGLLVQAHYRTTPADLHRLLDAPNLRIYVGELEGQVVAANVLAEEGGWSRARCEAAAAGRERPPAHALPDALVAQLGHVAAGELSILRSIRVAVHPRLRRRAVARALVEHVHADSDVELFGTMFGATPDLVAFRRSVGYTVVAASAARGSRTGEPSVIMLRPHSARARRVVDALQFELARELPLRLRLLHQDDGVGIDPALAEALGAGLPVARPHTDDEAAAAARAYAYGPRTFESLATALVAFVQNRDLSGLAPPERIVVQSRILAGHGWTRVAEQAGLESRRTAMRLLRRAIRALVEGTVLLRDRA